MDHAVRTNIDIDDTLLAEARELTGIDTKKALVRRALEALVALERRRRVVSHFGRFEWTGDLDAMREDRNVDGRSA